jgi:hypothetical protein
MDELLSTGSGETPLLEMNPREECGGVASMPFEEE